MSDIIDSIKQGASQVISGIDQKGQIKSAIDGIRYQLTEMERKRKITQLEHEIKAQQAEMKQLTEALGLQTLSLFDTNRIDHPELMRLCERINELRAEVDRKKADLTELKAIPSVAPTTIHCPRCKTMALSTDEFCNKCGERLIAPAPAASAAAASAPAAQPAVGPAAQPQAAVRLRCPKCKSILPAEATFCPGCGVKIKRPAAPAAAIPVAAPAARRFCASCGAEIHANARFCPVCGKPTT